MYSRTYASAPSVGVAVLLGDGARARAEPEGEAAAVDCDGNHAHGYVSRICSGHMVQPIGE